MALTPATRARGQGNAATTRPGETAWACRCGAVLAYVRGRTVTLPSGDRFGGVAFAEVRCPNCRWLAHRWLVPRKRDERER